MISDSCPFRQVHSHLGSACSWGYWVGMKNAKTLKELHSCVEGCLHEHGNTALSCLGCSCQWHAALVSTCFNCPKIGVPDLSESSIAQLWYSQTQQNIQMLFPWQLAHFNIWQAHAIFFILHFLAQLRTLKPPYYNANTLLNKGFQMHIVTITVDNGSRTHISFPSDWLLLLYDPWSRIGMWVQPHLTMPSAYAAQPAPSYHFILVFLLDSSYAPALNLLCIYSRIAKGSNSSSTYWFIQLSFSFGLGPGNTRLREYDLSNVFEHPRSEGARTDLWLIGNPKGLVVTSKDTWRNTSISGNSNLIFGVCLISYPQRAVR